MADILPTADPIQPEASTSFAASRKICNTCNLRPSIYTCPGCSTRTCSLPCSTSHKSTTGCTGQRNKVAYVPMNKYTWGTMMNDYVYLEDVGRRVGDWGKEIVKGGYRLQSSGVGGRGRGRGRGSDAKGRGRGGANTKRDMLKMQLEARDIDMDVLPVGMERRKINQSYWELKNRTALLTIEFQIHPPRDPLSPSSQSPDPPFVLLTHKNNLNTPLLSLARKAAERVSKKHEWINRFLFPDSDDPDSFVPPHFVMMAQIDPRAAAALQSPQHRATYYRFDPTQPLSTLLRNTHFVEFPTIEIWNSEEFTGTVVDVQGTVKELPLGDEPRPKRRKLSVKAGKQAINGLLGGYGSEDDEDVQEERPNGLALVDGYTGSDDELGEGVDVGVSVGPEEAAANEEILEDSEDEGEVEIDPAVLLELMRQVHGGEKWSEEHEAGEEVVDWGGSGDEE